MTDAAGELAQTVRVEGARLLATLVRTVGDLQLAEDAVQEAAVRALRDWPRSGVPDQPRAWLTVAARRAAIDIVRRESQRRDRERDASAMALTTQDEPAEVPDSVVRDDQLRLLFVCCHPALSLEAQVPLALRVLCGLSPAQIADVLLTGEPAVAKRLTRARAKIARAAIPYRVPGDAELPARLAGVCAVVHAAYTAAHTASGAELSDVDGCVEARRLARLVHDLLPDEPMPAAVLALILLTEARRPARLAAGEVVLLADQDRSLWDRAAVEEGRQLLADSLRRTAGLADAYQLEAAVAAEHAVAGSCDTTDWREIVRLYDLLLTVRPTSSVRLARAVALAEADGATAGLRALDDVASHPRREAVRSELLARAGQLAAAADAARESLAAPAPAAERRHRERRVAEWTAAAQRRH
ncbi:RNA polymerase sigma factor [uncultured Jatrophihabitans sp.]|uniref:RNA polymerase sigma factor n=1 Tax=uncultured Jatrophihabitans sp. TaxID=1610747 RepID=UPI0035C9D6EB